MRSSKTSPPCLLSCLSQLHSVVWMGLLKVSYLASFAAEDTRIARAVNGEIVSESELDRPKAYVVVSDPLSTASKELIAKRAKIQEEQGEEERRLLPISTFTQGVKASESKIS